MSLGGCSTGSSAIAAWLSQAIPERIACRCRGAGAGRGAAGAHDRGRSEEQARGLGRRGTARRGRLGGDTDPLASATARWPGRCSGQILRAYGEQPSGARNDGLDIGAAEGSPVHAVDDGVVRYAGSDLQGYGNMLLIAHADGYTSVYAHNRSLLVGIGATVHRGQPIATVGRSGAVVEAQLHFQLRAGDRPVDPGALSRARGYPRRELGTDPGIARRRTVNGHVVPPAAIGCAQPRARLPDSASSPHAVDDNAYTAALLVGCLIGVGLAWQVILSEGASPADPGRNGRPRYLGQSGRGRPSPSCLCPVRPPTMEFSAGPAVRNSMSLPCGRKLRPNRWQFRRPRRQSSPSLWPCPYPSVWCWPKRRSRPSQRRPGRERPRWNWRSSSTSTAAFWRRPQSRRCVGWSRNCRMAVRIGWRCRQPSATTASRVRSPRRRSATIVGSPSVVSTGSPTWLREHAERRARHRAGIHRARPVAAGDAQRTAGAVSSLRDAPGRLDEPDHEAAAPRPVSQARGARRCRRSWRRCGLVWRRGGVRWGRCWRCRWRTSRRCWPASWPGGLVNFSFQNVTEERTLILALLIAGCLVVFQHFGHYSRRRQFWQELGDIAMRGGGGAPVRPRPALPAQGQLLAAVGADQLGPGGAGGAAGAAAWSSRWRSSSATGCSRR